MILLQQTMREYLELRLAQLDILFAQTDMIMENLRLLDNRPSQLIKQIYRFQRQCRYVKRDLICAEHCDLIHWERMKLRLDQSCDHVKNLFHQLRSQAKSCRIDKLQTAELEISPSTNFASALADPSPAFTADKLTVNNTIGEKKYAAEHSKHE